MSVKEELIAEARRTRCVIRSKKHPHIWFTPRQIEGVILDHRRPLKYHLNKKNFELIHAQSVIWMLKEEIKEHMESIERKKNFISELVKMLQ